jgi:hypothetical protein
MDWPVEGWLQIDAGPAEPVEVILVDFSSLGLAVVLSAAHPLRPGQRGELITQSHGAGCNHRPVRCSWQQPHPVDRQLQCAGLSFR